MKLTSLILSMAIALAIMMGCIEDKDNQTGMYTEIEQSLSEDGFTKVDHVKQNIASRFIGIKRNKPSSRTEKQASKKLPSANYHFDKPRLLQSEYQVIAENNLFRPLGWKKEVLTETTPKTENPVVEIRRERPALTYNLTLTGIAQNGSEWIAIVEDETEKEGYFLNRGEKLKDSLVSEIFEEQIILVIGGEKVQFPLGASIQYDANEHIILNTITNQKPALERSEETLSSIPKSEIRIPNSGGDVQKSLIERMKARRRKELGQE